MAQNWMGGTYSSFAAVTPSNTTLINCRAIFAAGAGTIVVAPSVNGTQVTFTVIAGQVLPIELNQGIIAAASTATGIVVLQ